MIYQLVSCKVIFARLENNFSIDYSDWITRAPLWVADSLDQMQIVSSYEDKYIDLEVEDYKIMLPDECPQDIRRIQGITYNNTRLHRLNNINPISLPSDLSNLTSSSENYIIKNGHITTSFKEGTTRLYFQSPAIEYDTLMQMYLPKVPNDSVLQGAVQWYIIYSILLRGHKHPTFSLDSKNPITNPYTMWIQESKKAKNRLGTPDLEERSQMSKLLNTFIINTELPLNEVFRANGSTLLKNSITGQIGITDI
jgi:hypothetical protein